MSKLASLQAALNSDCYLQEHGIHDLPHEIVAALLQEKPANPTDLVCSIVQRKSNPSRSNPSIWEVAPADELSTQSSRSDACTSVGYDMMAQLEAHADDRLWPQQGPCKKMRLGESLLESLLI